MKTLKIGDKVKIKSIEWFNKLLKENGDRTFYVDGVFLHADKD
jgi:hypothetical protein